MYYIILNVIFNLFKAVLVQIMQQHRMRDMFKPSMAELGVCMYQLENLVLEQFPDLHIHFQSQQFQTSMYASRWFLTLFTTSLNLQISCRVMDIFLSEGMEFIFKMALAMLAIGKESLLSLDMEAMLKVPDKLMSFCVYFIAVYFNQAWKSTCYLVINSYLSK